VVKVVYCNRNSTQTQGQPYEVLDQYVQVHFDKEELQYSPDCRLTIGGAWSPWEIFNNQPNPPTSTTHQL